jgi:hypothetical protein
MTSHAPFADLSNVGGHITSPETPAGKPGPRSGQEERGADGSLFNLRKHSPWTAARNKKKTKNVLLSDDDDPMPACFSSPGAGLRSARRCDGMPPPQAAGAN